MRHLLLPIALAALLCATTARGQAPTVHNLSFDVENKGAGGGVKTGGGVLDPNNNNNNNNRNGQTTTTATSTDTRNHSTTLGVSIRSLDKTPDAVKVEWYFFGRKIENHRASKETVFDSGSKDITIAPTGGADFDITSKVQQSTVKRTTTTTTNNNNNANNRNNVSTNTTETRGGSEISGWVVTLVVDGKVFAAKGSDFKYEDAAKNPDKFAQLKAGKLNE